MTNLPITQQTEIDPILNIESLDEQLRTLEQTICWEHAVVAVHKLRFAFNPTYSLHSLTLHRKLDSYDTYLECPERTSPYEQLRKYVDKYDISRGQFKKMIALAGES